MKRLVLIVVGLILLTACQEKKAAPDAAEMAAMDKPDPNMEKFERNTATARDFLQAFCDKDSTKMFSYISDDFIWSPPSVGRDSLPREAFTEAMKGFMTSYNDIQLTDAQYFAGLDDNQKPNGDVRAYGLWKSKMADSGKDARLKWYAVMFFNDEGKIIHHAEWYDTADLAKVYEGDME